jgi:hypothetical protein
MKTVNYKGLYVLLAIRDHDMQRKYLIDNDFEVRLILNALSSFYSKFSDFEEGKEAKQLEQKIRREYK